MNYIPWTEIVEFVRVKHNGVMAVYLYFGHDGDNYCEFCAGDGKIIASANSGRTMQEAVERCYYEWYLGHRAQIATRSGWDEFAKQIGLEQ